jgi:hypothetical protein
MYIASFRTADPGTHIHYERRSNLYNLCSDGLKQEHQRLLHGSESHLLIPLLCHSGIRLTSDLLLGTRR